VNSTVAKFIKIASSLVITSALGLLGWNLFLHLQGASLPSNLTSLFRLGSFILVAHGVEGMIAAFKASAYNQKPIPWVVYTFFVGFVGLQELVNQESD
jgi:hypothetical protein